MIDLEILNTETIVETDGPRRTTTLASRRSPLTAPAEQIRALNATSVMGTNGEPADFDKQIASHGWNDLRPETLDILQINIGKLCNMTCRHCHVDSGPDRVAENMNRATVDACIEAVRSSGAHTVDVTGGAPELNPHFEYLVDECVKMGKQVIDRCNLTILTVKRYQHLPQWFADRGVQVVCSLPHFRELGTDAQRGDGTFGKSITALQMLNRVGYGLGHADKQLTLVTNPVGAFLAGNQQSLELEWKQYLQSRHGVSFDSLIALNNMPMSRYLEWLMETGQVEEYLQRLVNAFNPATITGLMCRNTLSVNWKGELFDCDFNQQLEMHSDFGADPMTIHNFDLERWRNHRIATERHCFGCTAGAGSGCGGAIA